ncbi:Ras- protein Rab-24 [Desmophyllum pertusum]|uniref:Ras- protein Rab-24 n=1 Tax=Desmophyllum pertusum TaxID=174260 RepID=A0A9X0CF84_9CNID|nr:Ras- protein Rab-24 [Desmophyllum pertusum]
MSRIYYRGAKAAVLCYDITDKSSFDRAKYWVNELKTYEESCKIYLCGTKYDMVQSDKKLRHVDYHVTTDYADEIDAKVFETSSKTGHNVEELFFELAQDYSKEEDPPEVGDVERETLELTEPTRHGRPACCGIKL